MRSKPRKFSSSIVPASTNGLLLGFLLVTPAPPCLAQSPAPSPIEAIGEIAAPAPQAPPRVAPEREQETQNLRIKREERVKREEEGIPKPLPYGKKVEAGLKKEALKDRPRVFMAEWSLVLSKATTSGDRKGYTSDPNTHFSFSWRHGGNLSDDHIGLWYGFRVAPFSGSGFYENHPGTYGLTYFGPMVGIGSLNSIPKDHGQDPKTSDADGLVIPSTEGWLLTGGLAAVSKVGKTGDNSEVSSKSDFVTNGASSDGAAVWTEMRYLKVLYGAAGFNFLVGLQTGRGKFFTYTGLGVGLWY